MSNEAKDRQMIWYRAFDELTGYHHFQAENSEEAFIQITRQLGYTTGVQIHDLSREMEWRCICTEEPHEFINTDFPKLPGIWKCSLCETVFVHPPDEINWEYIQFHQDDDDDYEPDLHEGALRVIGNISLEADDEPYHGSPYYESDYELEMDLEGEEE